MDKEADWESFARYVAGESSEAEQERIRAWAAADPRHRELLESAGQTWGASGHAVREWDAVAAWSRVQRRLEGREGAGERRRRTRSLALLRTPARWLGGAQHWAVAAALAAILGGGVAAMALWTWGRAATRSSLAQELTTPKGGRATVRLADGSRVVLGPDSHLSIPPDFGRSRRDVELTGEAFFDVAHDAAHPFSVRSGAAVTQVLGTQFDVRAYPDAGNVRVVVAEGRVWFRAQGQPNAKAAVLLPGDMGELADGSARVTRRRVDPDAYLGWQQGVLTFDDAPLSEVAAELQRWFGVQVRIGDPSLRGRRLTASFHDQSLDEVTAVIAASLGLECVKIGDVRTFLPAGGTAALAAGRSLSRGHQPHQAS